MVYDLLPQGQGVVFVLHGIEAQLIVKLSAKNPTEQKFSGVLVFAFDCEFALTDCFKPR